MKVSRLDREYQQCISAQIKTDPNQFKGLAHMMADEESEEEEFGEF